MPPLSLLKYPFSCLLSFPFPLFSSFLASIEIRVFCVFFFFISNTFLWRLAWFGLLDPMFLAEEAVHDETGFNFTPEELEELLSYSYLESAEPVSPNSGSEGSSRALHSVAERKQRRMMSNRESARRSRWRKKRYLENLTDEVNKLTIENQQLKNWLSLVINQCHVVWLENEQLRSESIALWAKLLDLYWTFAAMQTQ